MLRFYFSVCGPEAIKHFGETGKGNVIFLDGSTDGMNKTVSQMMGMMKMSEKAE